MSVASPGSFKRFKRSRFFPVLGSVAVATLAMAAGGLTVLAVGYAQTSPPARVGLVISAAVAILVLLGLIVFRGAARDWFHPLGFPIVYMGLALFAPVIFLLGLDRSIANIDPGDVSLVLVAIFAVTILGFAVGARLGMSLTEPTKSTVGEAIDYARIRRIGELVLLGIVVLRVIRLPGSLASPYGAGFVSYDPETFLKTVEDGLVFISVMVISVANAQLGRSVLRPVDVVLFGVFVAATLATGSRGELVAPAVFVLWAHHTFVRRISFAKGLLMGLAVVLIFTLVFVYRSGRQIQFREPESVVGQALSAVSTPVFITGEVVTLVPHHHDFYYGSTYIASVKRQLPGPVSRLLWGDPRDTGTYVFRHLISFHSPDAGYAFAFPAEAYLNFGMFGVVTIPALAGLLFGFAYLRQSPRPSRALHLLYPVLVATLPLSLRSDALVQLKGVLYPIIFAWVIFRVSKLRMGRLVRLNAGSVPALPTPGQLVTR